MTREREIGGYFALELSASLSTDAEKRLEFHTIRSALLALLSKLTPEGSRRTLWFPYFICPSVERVLENLTNRVDLRKYNIRSDLSPNVPEIGTDDLFYSYNIFGLSPPEVREGAIIDNAHAYFLKAAEGQHSLYSARKFLGVPDGAYLRTSLDIEQAQPFFINENAVYILMRQDQGADAGFGTYQRWEENIFSGEVRGMSNLSRLILATVDYANIKQQRIANFRQIHSQLHVQNGLCMNIEKACARSDFVPYTYPFLTEAGASLRKELIKNRIYSPTLWRGIEANPGLTDFERDLAVNTVHIPIDQRYGELDMDRILGVVNNFLD